MTGLGDLKIKIFADGADLSGMLVMAKNPARQRFYDKPVIDAQGRHRRLREVRAHEALAAITDKPISFEVFVDDFPSMTAQGRQIGSWGKNVNVKVPVTDTAGRFGGDVITALSREGITLNVTAIMTLDQVRAVAEALTPEAPAIVSVFAGRIVDTGMDPVPHMRACVEILKSRPRAELVWASPREVLNLFQAEEIGCTSSR